jgi:peptide/nickel transport system permease protein
VNVRAIALRVARGAGVLWGSLSLVFVLFLFVPDPARQLAGQNESEAAVAAIRTKYGLDRPASERYLDFLGGLSPFRPDPTGNWRLQPPDLGRSYLTDRPVTAALADALPGTLLLASLAMAGALAAGITVGLLLAAHPGSRWDTAVLGAAALGMSAPSFVVALAVAWLFGSVLHAYTGLPMTGGMVAVDPFYGPQLAWSHAILPAFTLALRPLSVVIQLTRNAALDVLASSYIRTARSQGLSTFRLFTRHVIRNAMNPVLTAATGWFAGMLAGAVFVEFVFGWKGMGMLMFRALEQNDLPVVLGCVAVVATTFVALNAGMEGVYRALDPRIRKSE